MELKMTLKDGTEVELSEAGYPQHYVIADTTVEAFQEIWNKLTEDNLSEITITENGFMRIVYGSKLSGIQTMNNADGTITGHIYMMDGSSLNNDALEEEVINLKQQIAEMQTHMI